MTTTEQKIKELEEKGDFNSHIYPIDWQVTKPVDADFPYIPKGWQKIKYAFVNLFVVKPLRFFQAKIALKVKVKGKHNLKGVKSAILTSNHVAVFDCLAISHALKRRKLKFVAAEFNNRKGWFGEGMRAHGMLPLSSKFQILKRFNNALEHFLLYNNLIVIYPEEAMWPLYEKPRPYRKGAFYYAAKFDVPVVPVFITYRESGKKNKDGSPRKYFTVNFAPPVYPKKEYTTEENTEYLKNAAFNSSVQIYESTYNKKLIY